MICLTSVGVDRVSFQCLLSKITLGVLLSNIMPSLILFSVAKNEQKANCQSQFLHFKVIPLLHRTKTQTKKICMKNNFQSSLVLICLWVIISFMFTFFHFLKYFCWYWKWKFDCKIQSTVLQEWYRIFSKNWFRHIDNFVIYLSQVNWKIWRKNQIRDFKI